MLISSNFVRQTVKFCCYEITSNGIVADSRKVKAIKDFSSPTNIFELHSFLGLVNQLGDFTTGALLLLLTNYAPFPAPRMHSYGPRTIKLRSSS